MPLQHLRLSDEVTLLIEPDKPMAHGCSMKRKERGPDSTGEQGNLSPAGNRRWVLKCFEKLRNEVTLGKDLKLGHNINAPTCLN